MAYQPRQLTMIRVLPHVALRLIRNAAQLQGMPTLTNETMALNRLVRNVYALPPPG